MLATPFAYVGRFVILRDVWIRTQRAAVVSRCATNLATHLPKLASHCYWNTICSYCASLSTMFSFGMNFVSNFESGKYPQRFQIIKRYGWQTRQSMVDRMTDGRQSGDMNIEQNSRQTDGLVRERWFIKDGLSCIIRR